MSAIATGSTLRSSLRDNVNTLKLVQALYRSMDTGTSIDL
jgi:hypothetical protein